MGGLGRRFGMGLGEHWWAAAVCCMHVLGQSEKCSDRSWGWLCHILGWGRGWRGAGRENGRRLRQVGEAIGSFGLASLDRCVAPGHHLQAFVWHWEPV